MFFLDYRKEHEHKFTTAFNDTLAVYNWLLTNANTLNIDVNKIAVAGDNVGSSLATALCIALKKTEKPKPITDIDQP